MSENPNRKTGKPPFRVARHLIKILYGVRPILGIKVTEILRILYAGAVTAVIVDHAGKPMTV